MDVTELLEVSESGLYCPAGQFFIDPWRPVDRAVVTHAHADHACRGCGRYLTARRGQGVLSLRMGPSAVVDSLDPGESVMINGVRVSLHPAGHILGSSQVRLESRGLVAVVSGDYKVEPDTTCDPFEPVRCHVFVSESTFGLPIYRWPSQEGVFESARPGGGRTSCGTSERAPRLRMGKAQRLIAGIGGDVGPIYTHGAVEPLNVAYRASGVALPPTAYAAASSGADWSQALIVAPPSAQGTPWLRRFGPISTAFASGWMTIRGTRRRRAVDRGFILSDHADWPGLLAAIEATGAEQVWLTHGYTSVLARWLSEQGRDTRVIATRYEGERDDAGQELVVDEGSAELDLEPESTPPLFPDETRGDDASVR
ncbi:MAG: ligase-associated DNA damage response exonuclease [Isosphaeraceae bacterium]